MWLNSGQRNVGKRDVHLDLASKIFPQILYSVSPSLPTWLKTKDSTTELHDGRNWSPTHHWEEGCPRRASQPTQSCRVSRNKLFFFFLTEPLRFWKGLLSQPAIITSTNTEIQLHEKWGNVITSRLPKLSDWNIKTQDRNGKFPLDFGFL